MASAGGQRGARARGAAALPAFYFAVALVAIVVALPTALRPPPDPANAAAEFSPDAPPDDNVESIVGALNRGSSSTAGSGGGSAGEGEGEATVEVAALPGPPRACPRGFGEPPRQTDSLYSAPCAKAFAGDNGGATARGVTATEVRVAVGILGGGNTTEGPVPDEPRPNENARDRTMRVWQDYFNRSFQFYGRTLRLFVESVGRDAADSRADAKHAIETYDIFGSVIVAGAGPDYLDELVRNERVVMTSGGGVPLPRQWYEKRAPYAYGFHPDASVQSDLAAEYVCKKLAGKPPAFNERQDVRMDYTEPRRFGLIYYGGGLWEENGPNMVAALRRECGLELASTIMYNLADADAASSYGTGIVRLRQDGVTSVIAIGDHVTFAPFLTAADNQGYFPEWIITGSGDTDTNAGARTLSPTQWRHAFGVTLDELNRRPEESDPVRAYKSIEPSTNPDGPPEEAFSVLLQIANGIQQAGPVLTPETFRAGLSSIPRRPPAPNWSVGGGYGPRDFTYSDFATELWWNPSALDPYDDQPGTFHYVRNGQRYAKGSIPREDPLVFSDGTPAPS